MLKSVLLAAVMLAAVLLPSVRPFSATVPVAEPPRVEAGEIRVPRLLVPLVQQLILMKMTGCEQLRFAVGFYAFLGAAVPALILDELISCGAQANAR